MKDTITTLHEAGFRKVPDENYYRHTYEKGKAVYMHFHDDRWELKDYEGNVLDGASFEHRPLTEAEICYLMNEFSQEVEKV